MPDSQCIPVVLFDAVASPILIEQMNPASLRLIAQNTRIFAQRASWKGMALNLAGQESVNLLTGQSLTNIDVADVVISGIPGLNFIASNGISTLVDINFPGHKDKIFTTAYDKGWLSSGIEFGIGSFTGATNNYIKRSDVDKGVIKLITNFNSYGNSVVGGVSSYGIVKNKKQKNE